MSPEWTLFRDLGDALTRAWRALDFDEARFPELATRALTEAQLADHVDPMALLSDLLLAEPPVEQRGDNDFGEPPLTVYRGPGFYIEVLYWLDATTTLHGHGFSGAFQVLAGSSLHTTHTFTEHRRVRSTLRLGTVTRQSVALLERGEVRPIHAGDAFIHALFHLDRPSVSLVVRTTTEADRLPQFSYLPPSVAYVEDLPDPLRDRRLRALAVLPESVLVPTYRRLATESDLGLLFAVARHHAHPLRDPALARQLLDLARPRHGAAIDALVPALDEQVRRFHLTERRALVTEPDLRFVLALLMNLDRRDDVLALLARRVRAGIDPVDALITALIALAYRPDATTTGVLDVVFTHAFGGSERVLAIYGEVVRALVEHDDPSALVPRVTWVVGELEPGEAAGVEGLYANLLAPTSPLSILAR